MALHPAPSPSISASLPAIATDPPFGSNSVVRDNVITNSSFNVPHGTGIKVEGVDGLEIDNTHCIHTANCITASHSNHVKITHTKNDE